MIEEVLHRRGTTLVRRLCLAPGEATPWHHNPFHRVTGVEQEWLLSRWDLGGKVIADAYRNVAPERKTVE